LISVKPIGTPALVRTPLLAALAACACIHLGPMTADASAARADQFGLAATGHLHNLDPASLARELAGYRGAGARWIRFDLNWGVVQAGGPRSWNWAPFDRVIRGARARGLRVLAVLSYSPDWARPPGTGPLHQPSNLRALARFARAAAGRYRGLGVRHWEIWNEPNLADFWQPRPNAAAYGRLLRAAHRGIKRVDRRAVLVTGGLSPATNTGTSVAPVTFLRRLYRSRARRYFDAVGHHASTFPYLPSVRASWSAWWQMAGTRPSLRSVMVRNGDRRKRIWVTEFSAPTGGSRAVSEARQAEILRVGYRLIGRYRWAGPLFWFSFRDGTVQGGDWQEYCGLVRADYSPKPALGVYQALARAR
jgi:polysaccharide biosynthesis protein PslG